MWLSTSGLRGGVTPARLSMPGRYSEVWPMLSVHACRVSALQGEVEAGRRLKETALRDFGPRPEGGEQPGKTYKLPVDRDDVPVPDLLRYALRLIGLDSFGPGEKFAWGVNFAFRGQPCQLTFAKFGLRLYLSTDASEEEANKTMAQVMKKLRSSVRTVEKLVLDAAPGLLGQGDATLINQHSQLRQAYDYFRERATKPVVIEDEVTHFKSENGWSGTSFSSGKIRMRMHAFHDMVAAITAYLSLLEHDLVLALAFCGFNPAKDNLTDIIGSRWGEKFERLFGKQGEAARYRERLTNVIERWRNPYSHGGFEKGHSATIYLHVPGVHAALPVGLSSVRDSPLFSFLPASETDLTQVFELFDELDAWRRAQHPEAMEWIESGLAVRFDESFREDLDSARDVGEFARLLRYAEFRDEQAMNMDY